MSILKDIGEAMREIRGVANDVARTGRSITNPTGDFGNGEQRFFERPMDSVARAARKSILYYPLVISQAVSPTTGGMLARLMQIRAAEYLRIMISNMDAISTTDSGKHAVIAALRGATLSDSHFDEGTDLVGLSQYVQKNLSSLAENSVIPISSLHQPLLEAKRGAKRTRRDKIAESEQDEAPHETLIRSDGGRASEAFLRKTDSTWGPNPNEHETLQRGGTPEEHEAMQRAQAEDMLKIAEYMRTITPEQVKRGSPAMQTEYLNTLAQMYGDKTDDGRYLTISQSGLDAMTPNQREAYEALMKMGIGADPDDMLRAAASMDSSGGATQELSQARDEYTRAARSGNDGDIESARRRYENALRAATEENNALKRTNQAILQKQREEAAAASKEEQDRLDAKLGQAIAAARNGETERATRLAMELYHNDAMRKRMAASADIAPIMSMIEKLPQDARNAPVIEDGNKVNRTSYKVEDFDKINRTTPFVLDLTVEYKDQTGRTARTPLTLAVKSLVHAVPSLDLVTGLGSAFQRDSLVLQFLRLTSGETELVRDLVLNVDQAKFRTASDTPSGRRVLERLRRQQEWNTRRSNVLVSMLSKRNFIPPTSTIAVTSDEVTRIVSLYGADLSSPAMARKLMQSHNLMAFIIVDESLGLVRIFEDGDDDFDRMPFSELMSKGKESSVKEILTIMGRTA